MAKFTAGSAVKYIVLPGIIPRFRELFFNGFSMLAYYIALIYGMARIIPQGHPYLNQDNIGKFGIRHAVMAAWKNLEFKWKNIDRIAFFFALISGLLLMLAYILGSFFFLMTAPAMAGSSSVQIGQLFTNPNPTNDIAFMMMDRMLGIPGLFNSKVVTTTEFGPMPNAFHQGLYALFAYFSWGMFSIAMVMLLYFIVDIVLETTMTGKPFGKRFENIWVPLRLVFGIGLLIPVSYGLNSAQWITLYVAKAGSNFATNGWIAFNTNMINPLGMDNNELVSLPVTPDFTGLAKDLFTIRSCKDVDVKLATGIRAKAAPTTPSVPGEIVVTGTAPRDNIDAYFVEGEKYFNILGQKSQVGNKMWPAGYNGNFINLYLEGLRFYKGKDVRIVFGRWNEKWMADGKYPGGVEPVCGEIVIPNLLPNGQAIPSGNVTNQDINDGVLMGAAHMFAVLKMTIGISKTGFGDEGEGDEEYEYKLLRYATDRYYYQETSQGQKALQEHARKVESGEIDGNPECMHDEDNDGIDNDGDDLVFTELGNCEGPIGNEFFINLAERYQRYFSYGPLMGYDYYTGLGQTALDRKCSNMNCSKVVSGATETCQQILQTCQKTRDGYAAYKPLPSVYYKDLGQDNPFAINRAIDSDLYGYGWGGAGIWYKIIAERNGDLTGATNNLPRTTHYPLMMEKVSAAKATTDQNPASGCEAYNPATAAEGGIQVGENRDDAHQVSKILYDQCDNLHNNEHIQLAGTNKNKSGNPLMSLINTLFGAKVLYDFRDNQSVNPMAQLAGLGRALIDKAIQSIMMGAGGAAAGGLMSLFGQLTGGDVGTLLLGTSGFVGALSKMMVSFAMTGLLAGILLFYVIPFLPFLYFFFAVGTWVKTIFEALVGVPLWALAHLRLDGGPGFAGKAASGGYYMLLEIFIRPIITVFSLVASMFIFMALAYMLNATWGVATANLVGFDPMTKASTDTVTLSNLRPTLDQFFYTIMYIVFMYMLATGSFKLIDQVPDGIMRWINDVKTWGVNDSADAMVSDISMTVGLPAYQAMNKIVPAGVEVINKVPEGIGGVLGSIKNMVPKPPSPGGSG